MNNREFICVPVAEDNPAIEKDAALCANCGQCTSVCPEQSLRGKKTYSEVLAAIHDPEKIVILSVAPSVRVGLGDCFQENCILRQMCFAMYTKRTLPKALYFIGLLIYRGEIMEEHGIYFGKSEFYQIIKDIRDEKAKERINNYRKIC